MKEKFLYKIIIIFFVTALIATGCGAPAATENSLPAVTEAVVETEAPPTRMPPPRMPPPGLESTIAAPTDAPVSVSSNVDACKLPGRTPDTVFDYDLLGVPRFSGFAPSTGTVKVTVLFADFSDARASTAPENELAILNPNEAKDYLREVSYGKLDVVFEPYSTWLNLPQPAAYYRDLSDKNTGEDTRTILEEAIKAAGSSVDFSDTDMVLLILNPDASDGAYGGNFFATSEEKQGIQVGNRSILGGMIAGTSLRDPQITGWNYYLFARWLAIPMNVVRHGFFDTTLFPDLTLDEKRSATGAFSTTGNSWDKSNAPGMFAYERWHFGWLDDTQIFCQTEGEQTVNLSAVEQPGGTKAVMVPLGEMCALVVESRKATGVDQNLVKQGALVYKVDTSLKFGVSPIRVLPLPASSDDLNRDQAPLAEGESVTYSNVTVTNLTQGADGDTVFVTVNGQGGCPEDVVKPGSQLATPASMSTSIPQQSTACDLGLIPNPTQADVMIRFVNTSAYEAVVYWHDDLQSPAQDTEFFRIPIGGTFNQESFTGDKWIIKDPTGGTLAEYTASKEQKQCISVSNPLGNLWLDFVNQSSVPATVYLVDANGSMKEQFVISAGVTFGLWTAPNMEWLAVDGSSNVLLDYTSTSAQNQQAVIPPLSATPTKIAINTNTPVPTKTPVATSTLAVQVTLDANNCPVIKNATQVICYDVTGSTEAELVASMKALTPRSPDWYGVDGYFTWNWDNACTPSSVTVSLDYQKPFFPRWTPPANASPALVAKWQKYIQIAAARDQLEVDYINQHYLEIKTAIQNAMKKDFKLYNR